MKKQKLNYTLIHSVLLKAALERIESHLWQSNDPSFNAQIYAHDCGEILKYIEALEKKAGLL